MAKAPTSILEKSCIAVGILLIVAAGIYLYSYTADQYDTDPKPAYYSEFPITGKYFEIETVDTGFVQSENDETLYPSATIRLNPSSTQTGAIRVFFRSNVGESVHESKVVGDSDTLEIKNGKFSNGSNEITLQCTKGLANMADFYGYKSQDESRWVLKVRESNDASNTKNFVDLTQAAIEPLILD